MTQRPDSDYPGFLPYHEYQAMPRPDIVWLMQFVIPYGGWFNIYGQPKKARKSYLALGMSWAIASGQPSYLGFPIKHHGPVLYLQVDTPDTTWAQRTKDIHTGGYDLSNVWFASTRSIPYPFDIDRNGEWIADCVARVPDAVLVIFDTCRKMHMEDENSSQGMSLVMNAMDEVAGRDRAKGLVSHENKGQASSAAPVSAESTDTADSNLMKGNRGSSAVAGAMDVVIKMTPKGIMQFEGRQVPEQHKRLKFTHVHGEEHPCPYPSPADCFGFMWQSDESSDVEMAKDLIKTYKTGSTHSLARILSKARGINEEAARTMIRRLKQKGAIE